LSSRRHPARYTCKNFHLNATNEDSLLVAAQDDCHCVSHSSYEAFCRSIHIVIYTVPSVGSTSQTVYLAPWLSNSTGFLSVILRCVSGG